MLERVPHAGLFQHSTRDDVVECVKGSGGGAASAAAAPDAAYSRNIGAAASAAAGSAAALAPLSLNLGTPESKVRERRGSSGGAPGAK